MASSNWASALNLLRNQLDFRWPSVEEIRHFTGNFAGIVIPELTQGFPNKVLFTPGYVVEPDPVRLIIRMRYKDYGRHFPLNLYNDTPIYRGFYTQWDDTRINDFCRELLNDGLIPVGSAFADGSRVIKPVVDPTLVPAVFSGWENPTPITLPALDDNNLFWKMWRYFPNSRRYWHNPPGQDAPYVNPPDWGATWDPKTGRWSSVNGPVWRYMVQQSGCHGLLFEGQGWINHGNDSVANLNDFVQRLILGNDGWPIGDLIDFEEFAYYNTEEGNLPPLQGLSIRQRVPQLTGYCNG